VRPDDILLGLLDLGAAGPGESDDIIDTSVAEGGSGGSTGSRLVQGEGPAGCSTAPEFEGSNTREILPSYRVSHLTREMLSGCSEGAMKGDEQHWPLPAGLSRYSNNLSSISLER
jgi:hypothetical protein